MMLTMSSPSPRSSGERGSAAFSGGKSTLSSGGSASMSPGSAALMSVISWLSSGCCSAWQAGRAIAIAAIARIRVLASRIIVARYRVAFGPRQYLTLELERNILAPMLTFAGDVEIAADPLVAGFDAGAGHGAGLVEFQAVGADFEQALGIAASRDAIGRGEAPAAADRRRNRPGDGRRGPRRPTRERT